MSNVCEKITIRIREGEPECRQKIKLLSLSDGLTCVNVPIPIDSPIYETEVLMIARGIQRAVIEMKENRVKKFMKAPREESTTVNRCI